MKHLLTDSHGNSLAHDLPRLLQTGLTRRRWMKIAIAAGVSAVFPGCSSWAAQPNISTNSDGDTCVEVAPETAGPYPSDGSNRVGLSVSNVLDQSGVVRSDIRSSFGRSSRPASGVPITITMRLVNVNARCTPLANYAVYVWHCDAGGLYSLYSDSVRKENYLRGVQVSNSNGELTFTTIVPGCYRGRFPHIHFEVFANLEDIRNYKRNVQVSQMAIPRDICIAAYENASYANSVENFSQMTLENDNIFNDNAPEQIKAMTVDVTGKPPTGYRGTIEIGMVI